jgi:hypothetical protein
LKIHYIVRTLFIDSDIVRTLFEIFAELDTHQRGPSHKQEPSAMMGRDRQYESDAERAQAWRDRKKAEEARLREELRRARSEAGTKAATRKAVSVKLVKVLGYLGSDSAGERDNAARKAMEILKAAGLTWYDVLDTEEEPRKK